LILPLKQVLQWVISLTIETYEGDLASGVIFTYQQEKEKEQERLIIAISQAFIEKKIGQKFPEQIIENI